MPLKQAFERRADLKAAEAQIRAAEHTLAAARDERLPSLSVSGDYGDIGTNPSQSHGTFTAAATVHFQIWQEAARKGISSRQRLLWPSAALNSKTSKAR